MSIENRRTAFYLVLHRGRVQTVDGSFLLTHDCTLIDSYRALTKPTAELHFRYENWFYLVEFPDSHGNIIQEVCSSWPEERHADTKVVDYTWASHKEDAQRYFKFKPQTLINRLWKNWFVHNVIGHRIASWIDLFCGEDVTDAVLCSTAPDVAKCHCCS